MKTRFIVEVTMEGSQDDSFGFWGAITGALNGFEKNIKAAMHLQGKRAAVRAVLPTSGEVEVLDAPPAPPLDPLLVAWRAYCAFGVAGWPEGKLEAERALEAAYAAAPVPERERALVAAGTQAACCCTNGVTNAEVWCDETWGRTP